MHGMEIKTELYKISCESTNYNKNEMCILTTDIHVHVLNITKIYFNINAI